MLQAGRIELGESDGAIVLSMLGEHDLETSPELERTLEQKLASGAVVIDLSGTAFVDSSVLAVLVRAHESTGERPGALALVLPEDGAVAVTRVFELTGLRERLPVHETREQAIESLGA